jgi:hypothetical protein
VSIVPFIFLEGNPATAVRSATEVLYIPRETLPAMEKDLLTNLVELRAVSPYQIHTVRILWICGFVIWITDLRYGFTEVRILWIPNKPCHKNSL